MHLKGSQGWQKKLSLLIGRFFLTGKNWLLKRKFFLVREDPILERACCEGEQFETLKDISS